MEAALRQVVQEYLEDTGYLEAWAQRVQARMASVPAIQKAIRAFVEGGDLNTLRVQLDRELRHAEDWGATGTGWMMQINKLIRYHREPAPTMLRSLLDGLNAENLGQRIETFHTFLVRERERLQTQGMSSSKIVSPRSSSFLLSLFAFWLDPEGGAIITYTSVRSGLRKLLDTGILPHSLGLRSVGGRVEVSNEADYQAVERAVESLASAAPALKRSEFGNFWPEAFLLWVDTNENGGVEAGDPPTTKVIPVAPLAAVPEATLQRRIAQLQERILVSEALVRRIYHALLGGHVILTGPPGTGKTELARLIPELLWQSDEAAGSNPDPLGPLITTQPATHTAYTTRLVTATDEWSVRTLIGGIAPRSEGGTIRYQIQPGHLTQTVLDNWNATFDSPSAWGGASRVTVQAKGVMSNELTEFRGRWLVIDEFNRAPIDVALGEALTALGGSHALLRVPVEGGGAELPIPPDFRIIGTLNSFDRHYLNQLSEALKRRFTFIEIPLPTRAQVQQEQAIVLRKALSGIAHLRPDRIRQSDAGVEWVDILKIPDPDAPDSPMVWQEEGEPMSFIFGGVWGILEVIRVYRQLGTAQAIALFRALLIEGILRDYNEQEQWEQAADNALTDTLADQLQVLLPDELEVLLLSLREGNDKPRFAASFNKLLASLSERRQRAHLAALARVVSFPQGTPHLSDEVIKQTLTALEETGEPIRIEAAILASIFGTAEDEPLTLPTFQQRLRTFQTERGL